MALDPSIALQVRTPEAPVSPLQTFGQLMQLRDVASQVGLRNAQTQHALAQADEQKQIAAAKQRDIADQSFIQTHMQDPTAAAKVFSGDLSALYGKVAPNTLTTLGQSVQKQQQEYQGTRSAKAKADAEALTQAQRTLQSIYDRGTTNPEEIPQLYASARQNSPWLKDLPLSAPQSIGSMDDLKRAMVVVGGYSGMVDNELKRQKEQADLAHTNAQTQGAVATTAETQAKTLAAERANHAAALATAAEQSPAALQAALANVPDIHRQLFQGVTNPKAIRYLGMSPEQQVKANQSDVEAARQAQTQQEQMRHNRAQEGIEGGRLAIEGAKNKREDAIYQQTYGEGANPALVGVDQKLRTQAMAAANKALNEHVQATQAADEMNGFIEEMRKGNKVAYSYAPTTGVLTINSANGVKRVNMAEIQQYEGAGSLVDKVKGFLGKQVNGQSIPANIVNDMEQLHNKLNEGANKAYNQKLEGINQNYRSNFQPFQSKTGGQKMVRMISPTGQAKDVPANEVEHYKTLGAKVQ